ncbi:hypothetical protein BSKO_10274 [Bryopsis sp. KO-2023]|nr:hypothetical protein BSKO_10274 [Bryopsis sp. KO-2023]
MATDAAEQNPFYLLRAAEAVETTEQSSEPTGDADLLAHFKIKNIHEVVVSRKPTNYLRSVPGYPSKMKLYKKDTLTLTPLAQRPSMDVKIATLGTEYLKERLSLPLKRSALDAQQMGELVEGEGWDYTEVATPASRETSQSGKVDVRHQVAAKQEQQLQQDQEQGTKIRFVIGATGEKPKKDKKVRKEKKEKKEKKAKKEKKEKRDKG